MPFDLAQSILSEQEGRSSDFYGAFKAPNNSTVASKMMNHMVTADNDLARKSMAIQQ